MLLGLGWQIRRFYLLADYYYPSCLIFTVRCTLETASTMFGLVIVGHIIAGFGFGHISAITLLYLPEICQMEGPKCSCLTLSILYYE